MLPNRVKGGIRPAQAVIWKREDGSVETLTGATLTGWIRNRATNVTRAIAGTLTLTDGEAGAFRWDFAPADVAEAGRFDVQFNAAFGSGQTPARTFKAQWVVEDALAPTV